MKKILFFLLVVQSAFADLPLSLKGIAPDAQQFKFGATLSYYNHSGRDLHHDAPAYLHTPHNTVIEIPGRVREGRYHGDTLYLYASLAYGLNADTELYASLGGLWREERRTSENGIRDHRSRAELSDVTLGINHVLAKDGNNPLLVGVLETSAIEKVRGKTQHGKSVFLGVNAYKAIDPVVFTLNAGYRFNFHDKNDHKPGNYFLIRPGVSFAANDRATFSAQVKITGRDSAVSRGRKEGHFETDTHAVLGAGYALSQQTSIRADMQWHLSGDDGASLSLAYQHRF